ncbi:MAG: uroporphyrinogen-III synthase [Acidobacteria bacterium]|nr:uroporphyrinogen-III synthase [Acidobacteriota bacterium]MBI3427037.1 uroporphyrinogen-III synthase [Acidobacteriota bacterium]
MNGLTGKRVALLEARMGGELANLVKRHGGAPQVFPALRETTREASAETTALIDNLTQGQLGYIVFQTGVGVAALLAEAEKLGRKDELLTALHSVTKICRGPKPTAVLARNGLKPDVSAAEPFTTTELLTALEPFTLAGQRVALLHYGERNAALTAALQARGAALYELTLYEWELPEDVTPLQTLLEQLPQGAFDAVAFTSQIQARHLFQLADVRGQTEQLCAALNERTVTASIGPTCSAALRALGVEPRVEPEHPKMGPMVLALGKYFDEH